MKRTIFVFLLFSATIFAQEITIKGKIEFLNNGLYESVENANVFVPAHNLGTTSDKNGNFELKGYFKESEILQITFIGFEKKEISIREFLNKSYLKIILKPAILESQTVLIKGIIGDEIKSPTSFGKIERKDIEENYSVQDLPEYLSYLPSTTFYSENGNGIGYNYVNIRGFDQRRISISVNGIPQNDPEDHNVYWIDMPDILGSTDLIQVQRGVGTGVLGFPAIGGSINIVTSPFSNQKMFNYSLSIGSYNTIKQSVSLSSGLIDNKYSIYAKIGKMRSSGYRNNSWIDYMPFHISAVRYDDKLTSQINIYGGQIADGLAYYGLPKDYISDKDLRKTNWSSNREIENFWQPHIELLNEYKVNSDITLNSALFWIVGKGFFDYDGSWSVYYDDYFRLRENGFDSTKVPQNALIRAQVENNQWGWVPRLSIKHNKGELILGGEFRFHNSLHWGRINYAENLPAGVTENYHYYSYEGGNKIFSGFIHENYSPSEKINILAELQLAYHKYQIKNEKYLNNNFEIGGAYWNPRLGINYSINEKLNAYFSFARVTREPRLKNYYDAAESSGGAVPQFAQNSAGDYNFDDPLVKPETMNDFELGLRFNNQNFSLSGNLYYMLFENEIVKNGQLDRFGQPITGNVDRTKHIGFELTGTANLFKYFQVIVNGTYSKNTIDSGLEYIAYNDGTDKSGSINLSGNKISGFPEFMFNIILKYNYKGFTAMLSNKYLGEYYSNNYGENFQQYLKNYPGFSSIYDNLVESYFVSNLFVSYQLKAESFLNRLKLFAQANNIFDKLYAAYAVGSDFYPAAERNFLFGMELGF